jgi:hypothetical protein
MTSGIGNRRVMQQHVVRYCVGSSSQFVTDRGPASGQSPAAAGLRQNAAHRQSLSRHLVTPLIKRPRLPSVENRQRCEA